jgi:hypothetical protein
MRKEFEKFLFNSIFQQFYSLHIPVPCINLILFDSPWSTMPAGHVIMLKVY